MCLERRPTIAIATIARIRRHSADGEAVHRHDSAVPNGFPKKQEELIVGQATVSRVGISQTLSCQLQIDRPPGVFASVLPFGAMSSKKNPYLEEEAEQESDADEDLSDSSEDDEGLEDLEKLREENKDFIVDEDEEEEDDEEEARPSSSRRKRRRRKRSQLELDDEDLNLVEENTVRAHGH